MIMPNRLRSDVSVGKGLLVGVILLLAESEVFANGVSGLDADSRRSVREAQMSRFGSPQARNQNGNRNISTSPNGSPAAVQNTSRDHKRACTTQIGHMTNYGSQHGTRVQQITVVDGNVINVCD